MGVVQNQTLVRTADETPTEQDLLDRIQLDADDARKLVVGAPGEALSDGTVLVTGGLLAAHAAALQAVQQEKAAVVQLKQEVAQLKEAVAVDRQKAEDAATISEAAFAQFYAVREGTYDTYDDLVLALPPAGDNRVRFVLAGPDGDGGPGNFRDEPDGGGGGEWTRFGVSIPYVQDGLLVF